MNRADRLTIIVIVLWVAAFTAASLWLPGGVV